MLNNFIGADGFIWFIGIVEDIMDPETLGRLKVRVIGEHTQNKTDIPTEHLPWAVVMQPINNGVNGIGTSPTGMVNGTTVVGFYLDGTNKQRPCIMGTIGGVPSAISNTAVGFNDPEGKFPMATFVDEPDTNRRARAADDNINTQKESIEVSNIPTALSIWNEPSRRFIPNWNEPSNPYAAAYPYNNVTAHFFNDDTYGHVEEWDSTPGAERYFRWHKSNTFLEIHPDGTQMRKIIGDDFEIDMVNKHLLIKKNYTVTVEGNKEEYIKGDLNVKIDGNRTETVGKNFTRTVGGNTTENTSGNTVITGTRIDLN